MEDRKKEGIEWVTFASKLFCIALAFIVIYLVVKHALGALLPFVIAYFFSLVISPISSFVSNKTRLPRKFCAFLCLTLVIFLFGALLTFGVRRLAIEISELLESASRGEGGLIDMFSLVGEAIENVSSKFGFAKNISEGKFGQSAEKVWNALSESGEKILLTLGERLGELVEKIFSAAPSFLIGVAVTVIASYYFCLNEDRISADVIKLVPSKYQNGIISFFEKLKVGLKKYAKAYLILMGLTFVEIFIGLSVLKLKYAFLIALGIAFIDILPVLGAGVILIPWAICALLLRNMRVGLGLLVLYGVITIVRQIAEPHVVGRSIGLHPAAALFSSYVGLRLFGFLGMILGPAAAFMISEIINAGRARG